MKRIIPLLFILVGCKENTTPILKPATYVDVQTLKDSAFLMAQSIKMLEKQFEAAIKANEFAIKYYKTKNVRFDITSDVYMDISNYWKNEYIKSVGK